MKLIIFSNLVILSLIANAAEPLKAAAPVAATVAELNPVLAKTEGAVKVLIPVLNGATDVKGVQTTINGKIFEVVEGVPGMKIPNGAILQTVGEAKAQVILENGNSFVAGKATEMVMSWAKDIKGKTALDINVKDGLVRGIVSGKEDFNVNLITSNFKASMKNAEFISGALAGGDLKGQAKGAMLKMIHGDSKFKELTQLANLKTKLGSKEMLAQAGSDLVMGVKDLKAVPFLQSDILKQATSLSAKVDSLKNASAKDWLSQLVVSADSLANEVGQQSGPPPDNCGCPSLEERLKRAAINRAKAKIVGSQKKADEKDSLEGLDPMTELACMSPVLSQLKGAAQIIKSLKDGIFSSKEAKPGDCVSNNSLFKSLTDSRSALKFPNGDEIFSSDNTDVIMKWTKKKLDLKIDQGSLRGVFKQSPSRVVNMQSKGLKISSNGGDMQMSAPKSSAPSNSSSDSKSTPSSSSLANSLAGAIPNPVAGQLAAAGALAGAAPAVTGLASGFLGSAFSVFSGLASAGGQIIPAGSQLSAGQTKPRKLTSEEISQLQSQTAPPQPTAATSPQPSPTAATSPQPPPTAATQPPPVQAAVPPSPTPAAQPQATPAPTAPAAAAAAAAATPPVANAPVPAKPVTSSDAVPAAAALASATSSGASAVAGGLGSAITGAVSSVGSAGAAAGAAVAATVGGTAASAVASTPLAKIAAQADPLKSAKPSSPQDVIPNPGLLKSGSQAPEDDFIKKYLNF